MTDFGAPIPLGKRERLDITKGFRVVIANEDSNACQRDPWMCVLANALNRKPGYTNAQVGAQYIWADYHGVPVRGELPPSARAMIKAYDLAGQIMPAGIVIEIIPPRDKRKGRAGSKQPVSQKTGRTHNIKRSGTPPTRRIDIKPVHP